jgi:TIR domain
MGRLEAVARTFVSYRSSDVDSARQLAAEMQARGHNVWLDEWQISVGDSIIEKIDSGLEAVEFLILCYSGAGVRSPWMSREWMSTLARQLEGAGVKIIPVRFSGGKPPPLLADIKYIDLSANWDAGMNQLHAALS